MENYNLVQLPQDLRVLFEYLQSLSFQTEYENCINENEDGRLNSVSDEKRIIAILINHFGSDRVISAKPRAWYDFEFISQDHVHRFYINVKSSCGGVDNAFNKTAIVYSLTNLSPDVIPKNMNFNKLYSLIDKNICETRNTSHEYYYLYIDKKDKRVILKSILDIQNFVSNPCNILQINWNKEKSSNKGNGSDLRVIKETIFNVIARSLQTFNANCSMFLQDHLEHGHPSESFDQVCTVQQS